jgi:murein DD-endopeptidase MepM/ murein hydrolase activator NlpD
MKLVTFLTLYTVLISITVYGDVIPIEELSYIDRNYNDLYESTIFSKNRVLKQERYPSYEQPQVYSYTLKRGEDIWTIVAKTSLTIDTISTLNRIYFIGELKEGSLVYLPDTIGIFFQSGEHEIMDLVQKYAVEEDDILEVPDPRDPPNTLLFLAEAQLSFVERTYLTGVVFYAPLMGIETSRFGRRFDPFINEEAFHGGIDIATDEGKKVHAARWGTVVYAGESEGYGNLVVIVHQFGYHTFYGHLADILVEVDELVESGQLIGTVGTTGRTTGPHLHFEIRRHNEKLNPDSIPFLLDHQTGPSSRGGFVPIMPGTPVPARGRISRLQSVAKSNPRRSGQPVHPHRFRSRAHPDL